MLKDHGIDFVYREYTKEPLTLDELRALFAKLDGTPRDLLRKRDAKKAGLSGDEADEALMALMADNPRLLQRPIGVVGDRATVGRPVEALLDLIA